MPIAPASATKAPGAAGCLFVLAAPSGGGKTSLVRALLEREPGIKLSVSFTTRPPRPGERDGVDYHFVDPPRFVALKDAGEFLEHAHVHGNWYATSAAWLRREVQAGHDVLLEIDWQGAAQVRKLIPDAVHIFILPPTLQSLNERLEKRGLDTPDVIARRVEAAREEMRHWADFDYVIMNQDFARAADDLSAIVRAARLTTPRQGVRHAALIARLLDI
jgi:guanylate kinase